MVGQGYTKLVDGREVRTRFILEGFGWFDEFQVDKPKVFQLDMDGFLPGTNSFVTWLQEKVDGFRCRGV